VVCLTGRILFARSTERNPVIRPVVVPFCVVRGGRSGSARRWSEK
jgi:hypothetical protein